MKAKANRIKNLADNFATLLEQERQGLQSQIDRLIESTRMIQGDTADRRLQQLLTQLKALEKRLNLLVDMGRGDYLAKIDREAQSLGSSPTDSRALKVMRSMMDSRALSLNLFCERLLDSLIETTGAERGFILFYLPESTEADIIAARNFQTRNLALEEYSFSRTLFREVFHRGESLLVEDASTDPAFSKESSVINHQLKSVLVTPLKQERRTIGALYLENNTRPRAFDEEASELLDAVARFAVFYLHHARLLPVAFETQNSVFLDAGKAATEIIGQDAKILELLRVIARIADSPATVLIEGESGTGKELVARALHYQSRRRHHPFVAINCAAIPDTLLESELFGHEKGAFTGATHAYAGRLEQGNGGTIFLDEISELAYPLQAKLLRFLQSNELNRLGGKQTLQVEARVVAATSKDLNVMMGAGRFQEALYYRLKVIPLRLPSLRERQADIPSLITHFLSKFSAIYGKRMTIERQASQLLQEYNFPGNVRELENLIHRLTVLAADDLIRTGDLPQEILHLRAERISLQKDSLYGLLATPPADLEELRRRKREIKRLLAEQERQLAERVIAETGGNLTAAASRLGMHRITLHKVLRRVKQ
jgi:Nif-specific regulatory protein